MVDAETQERDKYQKIWAISDYRKHSPGHSLFPDIRAHAEKVGARSIADYGCGTGRLADRMQQVGFDVLVMCDIAENCLDDDIRKSMGRVFHPACLWHDLPVGADMVVCTDVLEHIPPDHVDAVIANLLKYPHGFVQAACFKDCFGERIGHTLHLTVNPADWWFAKFPDAEHDPIRSNAIIKW